MSGSEASAVSTAAAVKDVIGTVGGAFMLDRATFARGGELGFPDPWAFYFAGRGGVLGDVDADVVSAAFVFFAPTRVRPAWEGRPGPAAQAATEYAGACAQWGRARLAALAGLDRLSELAGRVVSAADPAGAPLFAGWRAMPLPDDPPARAATLVHLLREHRGGMHAVAALAAGLSPLEAIVAGPGGAGGAEFAGWPTPYPDPQPLRERREQAEQTTDRLAAAPYAVLAADEQRELVGLLLALPR